MLTHTHTEYTLTHLHAQTHIHTHTEDTHSGPCQSACVHTCTHARTHTHLDHAYADFSFLSGMCLGSRQALVWPEGGCDYSPSHGRQGSSETCFGLHRSYLRPSP